MPADNDLPEWAAKLNARTEERVRLVKSGAYDFEDDLVDTFKARSMKGQLLRLEGHAPTNHIIVHDRDTYYLYRTWVRCYEALFRHLRFKFGDRPRGSMRTRIYTVPLSPKVLTQRELRAEAAAALAKGSARREAADKKKEPPAEPEAQVY